MESAESHQLIYYFISCIKSAQSFAPQVTKLELCPISLKRIYINCVKVEHKRTQEFRSYNSKDNRFNRKLIADILYIQHATSKGCVLRHNNSEFQIYTHFKKVC